MYRLVPQIAGKKAQCKGCGCKFQAPLTAGQPATLLERGSPAAAPAPPAPPPTSAIAPAQDSYELDLPGNDPIAAAPPKPDPVMTHGGKCPQCNSKLKPEAVLCLNCGYNIAEGKVLSTAVGAEPEPAAGGKAPPALLTNQAFSQATSRVAKSLEDREEDDGGFKVDYLIPLCVLGAGVLLILLNTFVVYDPHIFINQMNAANARGAQFGLVGAAPPSAITLRLLQLARAGIVTLLQIPFLFISLFIVARLFGTSFGYIVPAILKIFACAVAISAIDGTVYYMLDRITEGMGFIGGMFSKSIAFGTFWALTSWIFDLDFMEMFVLYILTVMLPIFGGFFLVTMLFAMFG
jgi:hypothetical protein